MLNINQISSKIRLLSLIVISIFITSCGSLGVNPPSNSFFGGSPYSIMASQEPFQLLI